MCADCSHNSFHSILSLWSCGLVLYQVSKFCGHDRVVVSRLHTFSCVVVWSATIVTFTTAFRAKLWSFRSVRVSSMPILTLVPYHRICGWSDLGYSDSCSCSWSLDEPYPCRLLLILCCCIHSSKNTLYNLLYPIPAGPLMGDSAHSIIFTA